jgi:hypothetical protein
VYHCAGKLNITSVQVILVAHALPFSAPSFPFIMFTWSRFVLCLAFILLPASEAAECKARAISFQKQCPSKSCGSSWYTMANWQPKRADDSSLAQRVSIHSSALGDSRRSYRDTARTTIPTCMVEKVFVPRTSRLKNVLPTEAAYTTLRSRRPSGPVHQSSISGMMPQRLGPRTRLS